MKHHKPLGMGLSLAVSFQRQILNPDGSIAWTSEKKRNLIVDSGMDAVANQSLANLTRYCAVGTSSQAINNRFEGITFGQSGNTVTSSAAAFLADSYIGQTLIFETGEKAVITARASTTECTVDVSQTISAGTRANLFWTSRVSLASEAARTSDCMSDPGDCGSSLTSGVLTHKRTFIFPAESSGITYTEIGWSWQATGDLFGRALIDGAGDALLAGQQYKVIVELHITLSPNSQTAVANVGTGIDTAGTAVWDRIGEFNGYGPLSSVSSTGAVTAADSPVEPSSTEMRVGYMASAYTLPSGPGTSGNGTLGTDMLSLSRQAYSNGAHQRAHGVTVGVGSWNTDIYGLVIQGGYSSSYSVFQHLFTTPHTKENTHKLDLYFVFSWQREMIFSAS